MVAFGVVLLLVFLIGRASGGGGGSNQQVTDLKSQLASAQAEIDQLDRQVKAAQTTPTVPAEPAGGATPTTAPPVAGGSTGSTPTTVPASPSGNEVYTVKAGDSLRTIALKIYGKTSLESCIAKAQNPPITDPTKVRVGQKLTIPRPTPTAAC